MRKSLFTTFLATTTLFSSLAYAMNDGFYVGGGLGGTILVGKERRSAAVNLATTGNPAFGFTNNLSTSFSSEMTQTVGVLNLFAGFGHYYTNCFYLGAELGLSGTLKQHMANHFNTQVTQTLTIPGVGVTFVTPANITTRVKSNRVIPSFEIHPGYAITPSSLLFLKLGGGYSKISYTRTAEASTSLTVTPGLALSIPGDNTISKSSNKWFWQIGVGMEQDFSPCMGVRLDYTYRTYGEFKTNTAPVITVPLAPAPGTLTAAVSESNKIRLSDHSVTLGLMYYF